MRYALGANLGTSMKTALIAGLTVMCHCVQTATFKFGANVVT